MSELSKLLDSVEQGAPRAAEELFQLVYEELRKLAAARIRQENPGQTLQPTALVHEVYLRLVAGSPHQVWENTGHFFAAAAEAMRRILVEVARRKKRAKHGGNVQRLAIDPDLLPLEADEQEVIGIDQALQDLEQLDPIKAKLVVLRYFGGLSIEQACEILGLSRTTAHRYWVYARAWLHRRMTSQDQ